MTVDGRRSTHSYHFDRHAPQYRDRFAAITAEMLDRCPLAWTDTYGGHWVAAGNHEVFELARCPHISSDNDITGQRQGYTGITIPYTDTSRVVRGGMLEMDDLEHRTYRTPLNPYLSPAAVQRWAPSSTSWAGPVSTRESRRVTSTSSTTWPTSPRPYSRWVCSAHR